MTVRFPAPLRPGARIGVTAPSSGVPDALQGRLDNAVDHLRQAGYEVVLGECLGPGDGVVSAPARERAAELTAMLTDPTISAVVPPWGGELAVEVLPHVDFAAIAAAEPTWLVGYSDTSTVLVPLTLLTSTASLHADDLLSTPYRVPEPLISWLGVATAEAGSRLDQGATTRHCSPGAEDWASDPAATERLLDVPGTWHLLEPASGPLHARGRLVGGCLETVSVLAGTRYGDVPAFAAACAPEGLIIYLEAAEHTALDVARELWRLRLAGWFDAATAVLVGRTGAPDSPGFTQRNAVTSALGDLGVPVVLDVDVGHVPPQLALVNGALADVTVDGGVLHLAQHLR